VEGNLLVAAPVTVSLAFRIPHLIAMGAAAIVAVLGIVVIIVAMPPRHEQTKLQTDERLTAAPTEKSESVPTLPAHVAPTTTASASVSAPVERREPMPRIVTIPRPVVEDTPPPPEKLLVKRLGFASEDDLRKQLVDTPDVSLYTSLAFDDAARMATAGKDWRKVVESRADLDGLPTRPRGDCTLDASTAQRLEGGSIELRAHLSSAAGGAPMPSADMLRERLRGAAGENRWQKPEAIPVLMQMLMAGNESIREVLVEQLDRIDGPAASVALAQRAIFDLHPRLRKLALEALKRRPTEDYCKVLVDGFRYPWAAVAENAAEAVVALKLDETVPALRTMLARPAPAAPFEKPGKGMYVREVVKINHIRNCLLCHDESTKKADRVRALVPPTDRLFVNEPDSDRKNGRRTIVGGYHGTEGIFVRADVTYIRQDFSVPLTVKGLGGGSIVERFDFVVRERPINPDSLAEKLAARKPTSVDPSSPHAQALLFALRELTGSRETR
jgi:hypothetical protein